MSLRFPNARLLIYDLMGNSGLTGAEAIARGACEYGLIDSEFAQRLARGNDCCCLEIAKSVFMHYFESKKSVTGTPYQVDAEAAWETVLKQFRAYKTPDNIERNRKISCCRHSSVLFDLMLQQFRLYS